MDIERQAKEIINKICSNCIVFPVCSTICTTYFDEVSNYLSGLNRENWLRSSKYSCDYAVIFLLSMKRN